DGLILNAGQINSAGPDRDVSPLFPFINAEVDDALYYDNPAHVRFLLDGFRCFLYLDTVAVHFFESRAAAIEFIPGFLDFLNAVHDRKKDIRPNHNQIRQIPVTDILKILPKNNCKRCGYPTYMPFAAAMAGGRAISDKCPDLASPAFETAQFPVLDSNKNVIDAVNLPISTAGMKLQPGCFDALSGKKKENTLYYVITFRKEQ
ncbi:MAG: hypothetical protein MI862_08420, partial [Desulfobacterales bacterium]|nr:hypothetical protein [Desulfobacterales bacterium]